MQSTPKISVIIPIYNGGTLLESCIESVLAQSFTDFELLLIDDASTDGSATVCARFASSHSQIRFFQNAENIGLSRSRNVGIFHARGQYITFVDADDTIHPDFIKLTHQVASQQNCEIVIARHKSVSPKWQNQAHHFTELLPKVEYFTPTKAIEKALYQNRVACSTWSKLYKKELLAPEQFRVTGYEDLDSFYLIFFKAAKIAYISAPLYFYTQNPASYLHTFTPERACVLDVTERIVEYMQINCPKLLPAARDRAMSAAFNILNLLTNSDFVEPQIAARCKNTILKYRRQSLFNPKVRLKNKIGVLATYIGGFPLLKLLAKI